MTELGVYLGLGFAVVITVSFMVGMTVGGIRDSRRARRQRRRRGGMVR